MGDVNRTLDDTEHGVRQAAGGLLPLTYDELRGLAGSHLAREASGQTLHLGQAAGRRA
jgi:hypothetical protein